MKIHILGICGTFMGSLALLAKQLGHEVSGSDANVYPPMSTQLEDQGITLHEGYDPARLEPAPDLIIVGNAMSRGNPCVEFMLNQRMRYTSGPQWLCDQILSERWVLAVAGTHGKTTTSSMLTWVLQQAKLQPGFLIGGVPQGMGVSASLGEAPFFVIEADEYDSAFFDKRSKFVHYRPRTLVLNNLEYDHADIFDSISDIQKQFHHLVRTLPSEGRVIYPKQDPYLQQVLEQGCWSEHETLMPPALQTDAPSNTGWQAQLLTADGSEFDVYLDGQKQGRVSWQHTGLHNVSNGLAAIAAARHVGVTPAIAAEILCDFAGVKRRMETIYTDDNITVYDDFAHHPTAIATTLEGLRKRVGNERIVAVIEPRSNTMRMGVHKSSLASSTADADRVIWYEPADANWSIHEILDHTTETQQIATDIPTIIEALLSYVKSYVKTSAPESLHIIIMSNGGFGGLHQKLLDKLPP